jgi:hypothetical protein
MKRKLIIITIILNLFFSYKIYKIYTTRGIYDIENFDISYNDTRIKKNIPIIEDKWKFNKNKAFGAFFDVDTISNGHKSKLINLSKSDVGAEYDFFKIGDTIIKSTYERNKERRLLFVLINKTGETSSTVFDDDYNLIDNHSANSILRKGGIDFQFNSTWNNK